jgi:hypothetical protein
LKAIDILNNLTEVTPLLCELVCNIVDPGMKNKIGEVEIYARVMDKYWLRFRKKPDMREIFGDNIDHVIEETKEFLPHLALKAMLGVKEFSLVVEVTSSGPTNAKEYALAKSGMVTKCRDGDGKKKFRFVHNTFLEYFCALHWNQLAPKELKPSISEVITLDSKELKMVSFLSMMLSTDEKKWNVLLHFLAKKYMALVNKHKDVIASEMESFGDKFVTRERLRRLIGIDICVQSATLIGEKATNLFMDKICPKGVKLVAPLVTLEAKQRYAPVHYRYVVHQFMK